MTAPFIFAAQIIGASIFDTDPKRSKGRKGVHSITIEAHDGLREWALNNNLPVFIEPKLGHMVLMNNQRPEVTFVGATPSERAAAFESLRVKGIPAPSPDAIFLKHPVRITVEPKERASKHRERVVYPTVVRVQVDLTAFTQARREERRSMPEVIPAWPTPSVRLYPDLVAEMKNRIHDVYHDTWDLIEALDELGECPHPKVRAAIEAARVSADNIAHLVPED